jgi:hypothetical protein
MNKEQVAEIRNYLLLRFNEYEVPITMTAGEVQYLITEFCDDFANEV